uniref:hypothetical protein n=1 Tax=Stenotrophomonas maltophilia TaxID=40324 RepID=UPI00195413BB
YGIHVDLHYRGGRTASATLTLDDTYRATGTVIGIAPHQLLDEEGPGPGIFMLHEAVQSERFMHSLEAQGLLRIFHGAQD